VWEEEVGKRRGEGRENIYGEGRDGARGKSRWERGGEWVGRIYMERVGMRREGGGGGKEEGRG
jgi:hypothetical protein